MPHSIYIVNKGATSIVLDRDQEGTRSRSSQFEMHKSSSPVSSISKYCICCQKKMTNTYDCQSFSATRISFTDSHKKISLRYYTNCCTGKGLSVQVGGLELGSATAG